MFRLWFRPFLEREDPLAGIEVILPEIEPANWNRIAHRNFNECPHCRSMGKEGLLWRYSECFPMISRSDGRSFHLYLTDAPRPFPAERSFRREHSFTLCFLYTQEGDTRGDGTVLVFMDSLGKSNQNIYRRIEEIADVLSYKLLSRGLLESQYDFRTNIPEMETFPIPSPSSVVSGG